MFASLLKKESAVALKSLRPLKVKLDTIFSKYIRARDGHKCVMCGRMERPNCGHVFSRVALSTRWDEENAFCQCAGCNMKHEYAPWPYLRWFIDKFGREKLDELQRKWHTTKQMKAYDYEEMIELYKKKLKELDEKSLLERGVVVQ